MQQIAAAAADFKHPAAAGYVKTRQGGDRLMVSGVPAMPTIHLGRILIEVEFPFLHVRVNICQRNFADPLSPSGMAQLFLRKTSVIGVFDVVLTRLDGA